MIVTNCECGGETKIYDVGEWAIGRCRYRECLECHNRFTTVEILTEYYQSLLKEHELLENLRSNMMEAENDRN